MPEIRGYETQQSKDGIHWEPIEWVKYVPNWKEKFDHWRGKHLYNQQDECWLCGEKSTKRLMLEMQLKHSVDLAESRKRTELAKTTPVSKVEWIDDQGLPAFVLKDGRRFVPDHFDGGLYWREVKKSDGQEQEAHG